MKHSLLYGLAVSSLLLFSCSKEEMPNYGNEANEPMPLTLENVTLKDFDAENPSRASYNQDAATVFVQNDKLGLILLKEDNTRKSHISFTYNANENKWTQDGNAEYLSGDVKKIIAYFPYNETLANDVNSVEALKNAISLTEDQSSLEDFKKNDLLISEITAPKRKLEITLSHAFSLIQFKSSELDFKGYKYNAELEDFQIVSGDKAYTPCNLNGTYSLLMKEGEKIPANNFRYFYTLGGNAYVKALTSELTMVSGKKYTFPCEIKGTFTPQPAPGDFYCTNASNEVVIFPGAATSLPEGLTCHGIVFHYLDDFSSFCTTNGIDNADNKYPGYGDDSDKKHGLVIGFSAGGSFYDGTEPDAATITGIYTTAGIEESSYKAQDVMNGYKLTQAMINGTKTGWSFTGLNGYTENQLVGATTWYAPSFQELKHLVWGSGMSNSSQNGLNMIINQVAKAGKDWGTKQNITSLTIGEKFIIAMTEIANGGNANGTWSTTLANEPFRPICAF